MSASRHQATYADLVKVPEQVQYDVLRPPAGLGPNRDVASPAYEVWSDNSMFWVPNTISTAYKCMPHRRKICPSSFSQADVNQVQSWSEPALFFMP